jgi:hypothetical protein
MAVRIYSHQLEHAEKALAGIKNGAKIAAMHAINRAMQAGRVKAVTEATKQYTAKRKRVADTIKVSRATVDNLVAAVRSRGKAIRLADFMTNPSKPQKKRPDVLKANVLRETGFQPIKGAFIAASKRTGKLGVFIRRTKAQYPIQQLYGPSIPEILGTKTVAEAVESRAQDVLGDRFNHEIGRLLRKSMDR